MYIVVLGCSAVGYYLAKVLLAAGHEVIVIEKNHTRCQLLWNELGSVVIQGDGTDERTLKEAGVARADIFIAV
ncbi:MAG TPA: NAD-binding protein, partial [Dehalococcoidia bacterium]|nr:NAD-binding protein [Dehalococcoidia bacterium]